MVRVRLRCHSDSRNDHSRSLPHPGMRRRDLPARQHPPRLRFLQQPPRRPTQKEGSMKTKFLALAALVTAGLVGIAGPASAADCGQPAKAAVYKTVTTPAVEEVRAPDVKVVDVPAQAAIPGHPAIPGTPAIP